MVLSADPENSVRGGPDNFFMSSKYFTQDHSREGSVPVYLRKPIAIYTYQGGVLTPPPPPPSPPLDPRMGLGLCCPYTTKQKGFSVKKKKILYSA